VAFLVARKRIAHAGLDETSSLRRVLAANEFHATAETAVDKDLED